jgi:hypothetical protein
VVSCSRCSILTNLDLGSPPTGFLPTTVSLLYAGWSLVALCWCCANVLLCLQNDGELQPGESADAAGQPGEQKPRDAVRFGSWMVVLDNKLLNSCVVHSNLNKNTMTSVTDTDSSVTEALQGVTTLCVESSDVLTGSRKAEFWWSRTAGTCRAIRSRPSRWRFRPSPHCTQIDLQAQLITSSNDVCVVLWRAETCRTTS